MKALDRIKNLETLSGLSAGSYTTEYGYDDKGRIISQSTTGTLSSEVVYEYDENDNIISEVQTYKDKVYSKTYNYTDGQISSVDVTVTVK